MKSSIELYIDPATYSTGWAVFEGGVLIAHGTIRVDSPDIGLRLLGLKNQYRDIALQYKPSRVVIEQMNRVVHHSILWAIGAVITGCAEAGVEFPKPAGDWQVSPSAWQKTVKWKDSGSMPEHRQLVKSIDELAAIGIGIHCNTRGKK